MAVLLVAIAAAVACSGSPISSSVQQGGTIVLPLVTDNSLSTILGDDVFVPAYGGTAYEDAQNGKLVIWLKDEQTGEWVFPSPTTRAVLAANAPIESALGPDISVWGRQLLLIADIPTNAPLGEFKVSVFRAGADGVLYNGSLQTFYKTITILPEQVDFTDSNGQPAQAIGTQASSFMQLANGSTINLAGATAASIPRPSFGVNIYDGPSTGNHRATYTVATISFPYTGAKAISIVDVLSRDPLWNTVWYEPVLDTGGSPIPGMIRVHSVTRDHWSNGSGAYRVFYEADATDPEILDLATDIVVTIEAAYDEDPDANGDIGAPFNVADMAFSTSW